MKILNSLYILKRLICVINIFSFNPLRLLTTIFVLISVVSFTGCKKDLDISAPKSRVDRNIVSDNDITATQAVSGIYNSMMNQDFFSGGYDKSITVLLSMSSDELLKYPRDDSFFTNYYQFDQNNLTARNVLLENLWGSMYRTIYQCNDAIDGLAASNKVTEGLKKQLTGEALFIRAFTNFYLVNLFGDVPVVNTTDYQENSLVARKPSNIVYEQIKGDLNTAIELLNENYPSNERVRVNKSVAYSLLARVHLYQGDWINAEKFSSEVIGRSSEYNLESNLNNVFLSNSKEAIWQLMPVNDINTTNSEKINSSEAQYFVPFFFFFSPNSIVTTEFASSFENGDQRQANWLAMDFNTGSYYPFKYKILFAPTVTEYSMVLRLAEIVLIRAEARAQLNDLSNSILDLDKIRKRAGLDLIQLVNPTISKSNLLLAIEKERKLELFAEWGHRWLDLKGLNKANTTLQPVKSNWSPNDQLYPIPQSEFDKNPKLGNQNPGY